MYVTVAIDLALDRPFTYSVPAALTEKLCVGQLLRVPFSGREARAFALALRDDPPPLPPARRAAALPGFETSRFRDVLGIADEAPFFSENLLRLVRWIASYTDSPIETCLKAAVPAAVLKPNAKPREILYVSPAVPVASDDPALRLTRHQHELLADVARLGGGWLQPLCRELKTTPATLRALAQKGCLVVAPRARRRDPLAGRTVMPTKPLALNASQRRALEIVLAPPSAAGEAPLPILLHGVTGSGKTEVYLQAIAAELEQGRGAIVLVPEISLTPQTVRRFAGRFGKVVAVLHSALSDGERYDEWQRIRRGEARVVVGPRSAVFAPVRKLGLIVVDEEHDGSYKQDETPRYHARDVAVVRARLEGARVVLGSATPALESWRNAQLGRYRLASLPERAAGQALPAVELVDLAEEAQRLGRVPIFSDPLLAAVEERLRRGEQTILFLNRRGYSRVFACARCGRTATCPNCSGQEGALPYTYHQADQCLRCHVCGAWERLPARCPDCGGTEFDFTGIGTQRAEAALRRCFPGARILRMDADSTSRKFSHDDLLQQFALHKADVLIGTQMISKGLDFPNVTLVGVLNADTALSLPDPRASERTYQLLAQVSGRAGRADKPGEVYVQTFQPEAPAVKAAADGSTFAAFAERELAARREAYMPPYCRLATLTFRAKDERRAGAWAELYAQSLAGWATKWNAAHPAGGERGGFLVGEAVPAALAQAEGWYRFQVVVRAPANKDVVAAVRWIRAARPLPDDVRLAFDVDALNIL